MPIPPLLRRIFSRKTFARLAFTVAALLTLLVVVIVIENRRGERAWEEYRAAAEKRGERLQLEDYIPPAIPDAENFAAVPVIQEVFTTPGPGEERLNPFVWPTGWKDPGPKLTSRATGEHIDLAKWRDAFVAAHALPQASDNAARDVLTALAVYDPVLQQLHEAAQRPHAHFPVKWELNISAQLPHIGLLRSAARVEALRMSAHLALGDSAAAYADWRDLLAIYRALEHEPVIIAGLVRLATLNLLLENGVWDGLASEKWADPELRAIEADLAGIDLLANLRFAMASERGAMNATIDWVRNVTAGERWRMAGGMGGPEFANPFAWLGVRFYPSGWYRQSQVKMNELYDHRLAQIDVAHGRFVVDPSPDEELVGLKTASGLTRYRYILAALLMPSLDAVGLKYALTATTLQEARVACALELFRRAHGAFPERLEELVPASLDAIPRDVMDGSLLHYRRTAGGFELWGVGWNGRDDGGKDEPGKNPRDQPDWVWKL